MKTKKNAKPAPKQAPRAKHVWDATKSKARKVKNLMVHCGLSLEQAKDVVERGLPLPPRPPKAPKFTPPQPRHGWDASSARRAVPAAPPAPVWVEPAPSATEVAWRQFFATR